MRLGKVTFALAALLILCGTASAQIEANRLCLYNGSEYYSNAGWMPHTSVNDGAGGYFPSFAHWASTEDPSGDYSWKVRGYAWSGMQGPNTFGNTWVWGKMLQGSVDNPYATTMTFDYPVLYCLGTVPHTGHPWVVYGGTQTNLPVPFDFKDWTFPSSFGGFDDYFNVFEYFSTAWDVSSTLPWYGWTFSLTGGPTAATYLGSTISIYQYTYENFGPHGQYQLLSGNEMDCTQIEGGQKGKNYYLGSVGDTNWFFYNSNDCTGGQNQWAMCLFLEDAITFPINRLGATNASNPYAADGFDVGVATLMPNMMSTAWSFQALYEDYNADGDQHLCIGSIPSLGTQNWKKAGYRLPGRFSSDPVAQLFYALNALTRGTTASGFVAPVFGTMVAGLGPFPIPFYDPIAKCFEVRLWGFNINKNLPSGAGFMFTMF
jgi:hypothetical protein